jgi:hypothetical protein
MKGRLFAASIYYLRFFLLHHDEIDGAGGTAYHATRYSSANSTEKVQLNQGYEHGGYHRQEYGYQSVLYG